MIPLPPPNAISRPYRGLSVQEVDLPLQDEDAVVRHLVGREVYRRTEWLLLCNGAERALVAVRKDDEEPLFAPVAEARVLAGPTRLVWIESHTTDVGNATALAQAVAPHVRPDVDAYVVLGRHQHVNAIWRPSSVEILVTEVVPPEPAKLFVMAEQAVAFDEDLPPVQLTLDAVDIRSLAQEHAAPRYLLPCRGSGAELPGEVSFLDTRPAAREDWLLIGCERSTQFHRHFYDDEPPQVDLCPWRRSGRLDCDSLVLTKCCLLERGVERHGNRAVVPWGATLDEVRLALRLLTGVGPLREAAKVGQAVGADEAPLGAAP